MVPQTSCPDSRRWRGLLEGTLPEPEQAELNAHLETCTACQQMLEGLAAEGESWLAAVRGLGPVEEPQAEPALRQALEELQGDFGQITTQAQTTSGEEIALDFLAPSAKPGALGRLDHYDVLAVVGRGGMGVVLKAFDDVLQRVVAIKVMAPPLAATASARKRFIREAKAAAAVRDEHVIDIHAIAEVNGLPYLVMEYINGVSLQERLDQSGPLELKEILRIGMQTAAGLDKAHAQGLIHRDIKPANILLENGVQRVKITDFGLARAVDDASLTQSGVIAGTPQYMAPEQARGEPVDHRADLFSLGSVLYAMCTGHPPFRASSMMAVLKRVSEDTPRPVREINPDIPDWLCAILDKLHAKEPAQRFQSAAEVAELLGQHLAHFQQPALVPMPPRVASPYAGAATAARKHALLRPVLLMLTPLLLIPVVMAASLLSGFFQSLLFGLSVVVSGAATVTGLIWFVWLTARQGQEKAGPPPPSVARPVLPRSRERSRALPWALVAACVMGLGCCGLGVPVLGMLGWLTLRPELRPEIAERVEPSGPAEDTLAVAARPFVLLPRAGGAEQKFATLAEAVAVANSGDTIEVRGEGPFVTEPIRVDKPLTIRAGEGSRPVLRLSAAGISNGKTLMENFAPLVLEGLELQRLNAPAWTPDVRIEHILLAIKAPLYVANCRFVISRDGLRQYPLGCVKAISSPACELRNCLLLQQDGSFLGITTPPPDAQVIVENCLLKGGSVLGLNYYSDPEPKNVRIALRHNTALVVPSIRALELHLFQKPPAAVVEQGRKAYRIDASENVLSGGVVVDSPIVDGKALSAEELEGILRRLVGYREERNLHLLPEGKDFLVLRHHYSQPIASSRPCTTLADWEQFWSLQDTRSLQGKARFQGYEGASAPADRTPSDFRLHHDSPGKGAGKDGRDLGADVDLVGPGAAYERWKKTPEYRQWFKNTGQAKE